MWRRCVLTVFADTNSSAAISGAFRLQGRYRTTRSSAALSSSPRHAARRGIPRPSGQEVEDRREQGGVSGPVARDALEHLSDRGERERQKDPVGLGELEGALDRRLCGAPVTEPVAGGGVEQQRLDRRPRRVKRARLALDDGRDRVRRPLRSALRERDRGSSYAQLGPVALALWDPGERAGGGVRITHPSLRRSMRPRDSIVSR